MKLRTTIDAPPFPFRVNHTWAIVPLGSCFSENMYQRLYRGLFHITPNPFGTSFNPISLSRQIERLLDKSHYLPSALNQFRERTFSFDHYTAFSHHSTEQCLSQINDALDKAFESLKKGQGILLLTLGTAHAWRHLETHRIVNNCHKLPGHDFERVLLGVDEITGALLPALKRFEQEKPGWRVILTVSPVRHLRDGLVSNQRSKAHLLAATHALVEQIETAFYFPAFELIVDDLRDYRFYNRDMIHPSDQAIDYVWSQFSRAIFSEETLELLRSSEPLWKFLEHRTRSDSANTEKNGENKQRLRFDKLVERYPDARWSVIQELFDGRQEVAINP